MDIYQEIWNADQEGNGIKAITEKSVLPAAGGFVRVVRGPASADLRILQEVQIPDEKRLTYDLVRDLFDNYALSEAMEEVETEEEREEVHQLIDAIVESPPMLVARKFVEDATGTAQTYSRWYATLLELWFRRFASGGDPALSGFEHVIVGEQEGSKVQGYHFWYKYWLDDGIAHEIDHNPFPGLTSDRIDYIRSEASPEQDAFPESVTIKYKWRAPDYDAKEIRPLTKPKGGFFVGCSVEGLLALGTVRAHIGARAPKEAIINGARYDLKMFRSPNNRHVRTFYPVFLGPSGTVEQDRSRRRTETIGTSSAGASSIRIVSALVNPRGIDDGQEKITILNVGSGHTSVAGLRLLDNAGHSYAIPVEELEPGVPLVIRLPRGSIQLSNKGGRIQLVDRAGRVLHFVSYTKGQAARENETIVF